MWRLRLSKATNFIGRNAVLTTCMQPVVTDEVAWSLRRSVCHSREPCRNRWTDRDDVWVVDSGGPNEPCIRWGPYQLMHQIWSV